MPITVKTIKGGTVINDNGHIINLKNYRYSKNRIIRHVNLLRNLKNVTYGKMGHP